MRLASTALLASVAVVTVACGGSADDAGSDEGVGQAADFCDRIVALEAATDGLGEAETDAEALEALRSLRDSAPDAIRDDMTVLVDVFERLEAIDENDPGSADEVFGILFDPAVIVAGERIEAYGVEECGLDPDTAAGLDTEVLDDPLYDARFDDPVDPNVASIDGLQLHLDENYPEAPWRTELSSFAQAGDDFEVGGVDVDADALEICTAVLAYATGFDADATAEVVTFTEDFGDETPVASGNARDGCVIA